ncbi:PID-CTERM protein-sorting domain-containing protein [Cesiribacter sp. SM1]|uniref:PID-CTERM protein-sorting domain-containing protein n=1 Tax=Cesiribacter sp. SM1 TaxID=2861196 RepID=UPI00351D5EC1
MRKYSRHFVLLLGLLLICFVGVAQPRPPGPPRGPKAIPVDGGISILAAAGLAYGARKLYINNKKINIDE